MYDCDRNGGCKVKYVGPPRGGNILGSCFPASFGGDCSGTPAECRDCNQRLNCPENVRAISENNRGTQKGMYQVEVGR